MMPESDELVGTLRRLDIGEIEIPKHTQVFGLLKRVGTVEQGVKWIGVLAIGDFGPNIW